MCFIVPPTLEAMLPKREATGPYFYGNLQHLEYGSAIVSLAKTDNDTSKRAAFLSPHLCLIFHSATPTREHW
jgi:hypothetical protein